VTAAALDDLSATTYLALHCSQAIDFGGGTLPQGKIVIAFDDKNLHLFSRSFPTTASVQHMLAQDGALYLAGTFSGVADFGDGPIAAKGPDDAFIVKLTK
jgi:hypothetical protein